MKQVLFGCTFWVTCMVAAQAPTHPILAATREAVPCFRELAQQQDSGVQVSADRTLKGKGLKRWLNGRNYRDEWTTPITVPLLDLQQTCGGLVPFKEGGGKQTRTLHLKDASGQHWVLRSVRKFPEKVVAGANPWVQALLQDGFSASYPYSVLSVEVLARAAGIPYLPNTLVFVGDDPALDSFRTRFRHTLVFWERRSWNGDPSLTLRNTEELLPLLEEPSRHQVDQVALLRARLFDNFIMDFDRHQGQWLWLEKDSAGKYWHLPVPKDRDQAFFKSTGPLVWLLSRVSAFGSLQGLRAKTRNIKTFNRAAWDFDRHFLKGLDEETRKREIDHLLTVFTDSVIEAALDRQPMEIRRFHREAIGQALKLRRSFFKGEMLRYYRFLSRQQPADNRAADHSQNGLAQGMHYK